MSSDTKRPYSLVVKYIFSIEAVDDIEAREQTHKVLQELDSKNGREYAHIHAKSGRESIVLRYKDRIINIDAGSSSGKTPGS